MVAMPPSAQERRLASITRSLVARPRGNRRLQPRFAAAAATAPPPPISVAFAGVHRSVRDPPAAAGGGGQGGPENPGGHNWASGFAQLSDADVRVTAVYDYDSDTRAAFVEAWSATWPNLALHCSLDDLLRDDLPDILCLATAQGLHAEHIEAAAAAGVRGIVVEKPLCTTLAEADRIFAAAERHGVRLANGTELRWDRGYTRLAELLADGLVGTVTHITAMGVGDLINHGCHFYDTMLMLAGDPEPVWARGTVDDVSSLPPDDWHRGDPPGHGTVGLSNGITLTVLPEGGARAFSVVGTQGRLEIVNEGRCEILQLKLACLLSRACLGKASHFCVL
jgi:predicted dehydrogenase